MGYDGKSIVVGVLLGSGTISVVGLLSPWLYNRLFNNGPAGNAANGIGQTIATTAIVAST